MFENLFNPKRALAHHRYGPLAAECERYLRHFEAQATTGY